MLQMAKGCLCLKNHYFIFLPPAVALSLSNAGILASLKETLGSSIGAPSCSGASQVV